MQDTFSVLAEIISQVAEVDRAKILPDANAMTDLGIDSLDFLDMIFEIETRFDIQVPMDEWEREVNEGRAEAKELFMLKNLAARIDDLIAAKPA